MAVFSYCRHQNSSLQLSPFSFPPKAAWCSHDTSGVFTQGLRALGVPYCRRKSNVTILLSIWGEEPLVSFWHAPFQTFHFYVCLPVATRTTHSFRAFLHKMLQTFVPCYQLNFITEIFNGYGLLYVCPIIYLTIHFIRLTLVNCC